MTTPKIHELGNSFDARNVCLRVALGMISFLRRFKKILRDFGSPDSRLTDTGEGSPASEDDSLLFATLGLISFSASMMRHLDATHPAASGLRTNERPTSPEAAEHIAIRELLR
jgi:hypothetical protein